MRPLGRVRITIGRVLPAPVSRQSPVELVLALRLSHPAHTLQQTLGSPQNPNVLHR